MPMIDMCLDDLKQYNGISPKPADFDSYWSKALSELDQQSLAYRIEPAAFRAPGVELYDMYFTGVGGAEIHCMFLKPAKCEGKIPAIAMFHGYQGNSGNWYSKLPFAYAGYALAAMDVRGQAGTSEDNTKIKGSTFRGHIVRGVDEEDPHKLLFRNIFLDTVQLVRILMSMDFIDENRIGATGYSQGGALTVACASLEPRVKLAAPVYPFLSDYKRVWEMDMAKDAYEEIRLYFRLRDPRHLTEAKFFERLGYIDIQNLANRIKSKVLWITCLMDSVCPPSTQFAVYNKITSEKKLEIYPDYGHEALPGADDIIFEFFKEL